MKTCSIQFAKAHFSLSTGTLPVVFVTETIMNHVAKALNKSPDEIREINFYKKGQVVIAFYSDRLLGQKLSLLVPV